MSGSRRNPAIWAAALALAFCGGGLGWGAPAGRGLAGIWQGALKVSGLELRIVFTVSEAPDGALSATMDSPDQGTKGIPVERVENQAGKVRFVLAGGTASFEGTLAASGEALDGQWKQGGASFPLLLERVEEALRLNRPQEPKPPFPYQVREVRFPSLAPEASMAGTLTLPHGRGPFPAVVLVTGSGPQNRDEEIFGHKPFLLFADTLTRAGVAVLRYDDRGVGQSTGDLSSVTSKDFADDAAGALRYLASVPEVNPRSIGLLGHSEGALIAVMLAAARPDVAFIVLIGGPGLPGDENVLLQSVAILRARGVDEETIRQAREANSRIYGTIKSTADNAQAEAKIREILEGLGTSAAEADAQISSILSPWYRFFLSYDPRPDLRKVRVPVLAAIGGKDLQVPPEENLAAIAEALRAGGNSDLTAVTLPGLNHLLQPSATGLPEEYGRIETTVAPEALSLIRDWILKRAGP